MRRELIRLIGDELAKELERFHAEDVMLLAGYHGLDLQDIQTRVRGTSRSFKLRLIDTGYAVAGASSIVPKPAILDLIGAAHQVCEAARPATRWQDVERFMKAK